MSIQQITQAQAEEYTRRYGGVINLPYQGEGSWGTYTYGLTPAGRTVQIYWATVKGVTGWFSASVT